MTGRLTLAGLLALAGAAGGASADERAPRLSLDGRVLREPAWPKETRARLEQDLEIARAVMAVAPEREDSWIWLGRRLAYLYRYPEAIEVFTRGLERFPQSYKLLRFRARKLARSRQFEAALRDYRRAAALMEGQEDSYEPDGAPNRRNQFLGSYRSNIHYYLGQTSWAVQDYATVLTEMERSAREPLVQNDDHRVATTYWRYLALRKLGRAPEARALVGALPSALDLLENEGYADGVRVFQGALPLEEALSRADALVSFAVAMVHHFEGRQAEAERIWKEIVATSVDGFWPAETELVGRRPR